MSDLETYQELLTRYLSDDGGVRYQAWNDCADDVDALDSILATWRATSPDSSPTSFTNASSRLSYWLNLYNALVIREVLRHWPLESVRDVKPTLLSKVAPLKGFFRDLQFDVGGRKMNLSDIENKVIRSQFKDARIHFALNCGSAACPILRRSVFDGDTLEQQLNEASRKFIGSSDNVRVDSEAKTVWLSKIFKWYAGDFASHAQKERQDQSSGVIDFLELFAGETLQAQLALAAKQQFQIRFHDYDWTLNGSE